MEQYISKAALAAEIEKRRDSFYSLSKSCEKGTPAKAGFYAQAQTLEGILTFLDTLETKEVDLEKEIETHIKECLDIKFPTTDVKMIAKDVEYTARMFFELGLKAQKGE